MQILWDILFRNKPENIKRSRKFHWNSYYWFECKKKRKTEYEYEMQDKGSKCSIHGNLNIGFHAPYIFLKESKSKMVSLR